MKKTLFFLLISLSVFSQTGIGTTTPNASAKLDVYSTNKGFLPPRVILTSVTDATTIASPAEGLLVYNLGSVGLQAGYYYWNGANWATIATATSAGNGVTATDMVKIYDGVGNAATINTNGATFSVTTSGKYLFDFSASATCGNCTLTLNFQVRDGSNSNAVLASDMQTSYNNNVHAEYNGKVEANLTAGRSYNVLVTASSGGIYNNDYVRVYMKQVSGNLPVTGQTVDYLQASLSTNQTLSAVGNILFNTSSGAGITLSSGGFNLMANKTYKLEAAVGGLSGGYAYYAWVDNANAILPGGSVGAVIKAGTAYTDGPQDKAIVYYTPTANTTVYLRVYSISGTLVAYSPSLSANFSSTWASIQQVGSSAFVNPWTLSGTNTYNTTGNVGIGNNAPTATLDVSGSGKFSTSLINSGSRTYFGKDGANMHWFGTTDNIAESNNLAYGFESNGSSIQSHKWYIGGSEKMKLASNGYLGIGTLTPNRKLHIQTSDAISAYIESTVADNNGILIINANTNQNWSSNWHEFMIFQNQGTNIGAIAGSNGGNMVSYNTSSDYRLKTDFKNYSGLDIINKIKTYDFAWKRDGSRMYGVMAHELSSILPYAVNGVKDNVDADGKMILQSVDYSKLTPILVKAIQEQNLLIKKLQKKVKSLEHYSHKTNKK